MIKVVSLPLNSPHFKMTEKFFLKWNEFQSNVASAFSLLRNKTTFQDVTLVSHDHKLIQAHKVVLSACSGYFNNVLSQNNHSHPLLCMDGLTFSDLNNILDYIYNGELQIYQKDLDRFLQIAQRLKLEGLPSSYDNEQKEEIEESTIFDDEKLRTMNLTEQIPKNKIIFKNSEDFQNIEELDLYINQQITSTERGHKCNVCNRTSKHRSHIREHMEMHINGLSFDCNICGQTMGTRNTLRVHKNRRHKHSAGNLIK